MVTCTGCAFSATCAANELGETSVTTGIGYRTANWNGVDKITGRTQVANPHLNRSRRYQKRRINGRRQTSWIDDRRRHLRRREQHNASSRELVDVSRKNVSRESCRGSEIGSLDRNFRR